LQLLYFFISFYCNLNGNRGNTTADNRLFKSKSELLKFGLTESIIKYQHKKYMKTGTAYDKPPKFNENQKEKIVPGLQKPYASLRSISAKFDNI